MADDDDLADAVAGLSVVDELKAKHKRELKDLEAKSTKLRHSVPKGDKKRLKEVKDEIAKMENDIKARHDSELKAASSSSTCSTVAEATPSIQETTAVEEEPKKDTPGDTNNTENHEQGRTTTRAQRRRDKKAAAAVSHAANASEAEHTVDSLRDAERSKISAKLEPFSLTIHDIAPNGDCLFGAVLHQLDLVHGIPSSVPALRLQAANIMRDNIDDYLPFMENNMDEAGFYIYCRTMETSHEWGGQMELKALSRALRLPIRVIQADGPEVELNDNCTGSSQPLIITFHRHEFGLGEHYNSTEPWENVK